MRVCFDEDNLDTIIPPLETNPNGTWSTTYHNNTNLWYSPFEIAHFKRQNEHVRKTLVRIDKVSYQNPSSWSYTLRRLHGACCKVKTAQDVVQILQSTAYPFQECILGLERQGIPAIAQCVLQRRAEIYACILELQYSNLAPHIKVERIRDASCAVSHASALYARMLAEIVAATITERMLVDFSSSPLSTSTTSLSSAGTAATDEDEEEDAQEMDFTPLPL